MRTFVLVANYILIFFCLLAIPDSFITHDTEAVIGLLMIAACIIPTLVFVHSSKPIDTEKEDMKRQIEELNKKFTNLN